MIGIAGPSGAGKSSLATRLAERVPGGGVVLALDAYYRDQRGVAEDAINVDVPGALDHVLLIDQVRAIARGLPIQQPIYDYATHSRAPVTRTVNPARYVIIEGLFALYWPEVRASLRTPVYLSLDHEACLARRVERDARERGRSRTAVVYQYERTVRPMYDLHVHPTRQHARLVLDASEPLDALVERLLAAIILS
ncbi:MAG TPA: AAA family ATPase [Candidatus Krumholzibacteria bacterium]|nr:AAA family ATPase [Candidatus Krumholzibacteria bacterium]